MIYDGAKNKTMALYDKCKDKKSWNSDNAEEYKICSDSLFNSSDLISENKKYIRLFSFNFKEEELTYTKYQKILEDKRLGKVSPAIKF